MHNATHAAEAALLGSLLLDLHRTSTIRAVLRPDDFATAWNQVVFTVLAEGQVRDIPGVAEVLTERLGPSRANIIGLHDLIRDVPVNPDITGYATMVVEASLRRQVASLAVLAQACGSTDPHTTNQISAITAMVRDQVHGLHRRWQRTQSALHADRPRGLGRDHAWPTGARRPSRVVQGSVSDGAAVVPGGRPHRGGHSAARRGGMSVPYRSVSSQRRSTDPLPRRPG